MGLKLTIGAGDRIELNEDTIIRLEQINGVEAELSFSAPKGTEIVTSIHSGQRSVSNTTCFDGETVRRGDTIQINDNIKVKINSVSDKVAQLEFDAPRSVHILTWFADESKNFKNAKKAGSTQDAALGLNKNPNPSEGKDDWENRGNR
jgi:sRNA-binding carbon storage regulator CsrA